MSNKIPGAVVALWCVAILANLGFWGLVIWAIIKLVNHYAG